MKNFVIAAMFVALAFTTTAAFADPGDRVENRFDNRGDRIDNRMDARGERINERLDAKGDRINQRLDNRADRAAATPSRTCRTETWPPRNSGRT